MSKQVKLIEIRENEKEILKIAEATAAYLEAEHNIIFSHANAIPTFAYAFLRQAIEHINQNKAAGTDYSLNIMQLLDLGVSYRENDEAEKEGNYTPYAIPGQEFKLLVKNDDDTEE